MEDARPRILIVEDEPAHAEAIVRSLERAGMAAGARVAGTLGAYREAVAAQAPDIVLLDLLLPDGRAVDVLTAPPEAGPFPILVMTSYGNERIAVEMLKAGAFDYLVKSAEIFAEMPRAIERSLRSWKAIQERQRAEEMLLESEERYRSVFENSLDAVLVTAPDGRIVAANTAACHLFGRSEENIIRVGREGLIDPHDIRLRALLEERARTGKASGELRFVRADGHVFPGEISTSQFETAQGARTSMVIHDLTERKYAELQLHRAATYNRALFEAAMDSLMTIGPDGRITDANAAFEAATGKSRQKLVGTDFADYSTDPELARNFSRRVFAEGAVRDCALNLQHADGRTTPVIYNATVYRDDEGRVAGAIAAARDVTELRKADALLRDNEGKYHQLFELGLESILLIDNETGRLLEANSFTSEMYGYSHEELLAMRNTDLSAEPEETRQVTASVPPGSVIVPLHWHRRKDGTVFPVEISGRFFSWKGRPVHVAAIRDITQRHQAEESIRRGKEEWERTFDSVPDLICILDEHHVIRRANRAMAAKLGLEPEDLVGKTCHTLVHGLSSPPPDCPHVQLLLDRREHTAEIHEERLGGDFLVTCAPLLDADGRVTGAVHVARDVTESKRLGAQLQQAMKMEAVGRLAGGVAHDFNNMLSVILGYADLALKRLNPLDPLYKDVLEIEKAGRRSADMTRQLLAFSRKQVVKPRVIDLNGVIEIERKMLGRLIGEDIDLRFNPAPDLWPLKMDPSQIDQVLANLAVNARDAVAGVGTVTIATANVLQDKTQCDDIAVIRPGDYVLLTFADTGCGMDAATLQRIFEPFFTTKEEGRGTGLGLATVYGIVNQYGGSIAVESEPGIGTTFRIYLPRYQGDAEPSVEPPRELPLAGHETVLIVEDEDQILNLASEILSGQGYTVLTARSPGEACLLVEQHPGEIHLLLTDVIMPGMNGKELRERVAKLKPGIRTIFMSGYTADIISHRGLIDEGIEFLQKPFTVHGLAEKVRHVLDGQDSTPPP